MRIDLSSVVHEHLVKLGERNLPDIEAVFAGGKTVWWFRV